MSKATDFTTVTIGVLAIAGTVKVATETVLKIKDNIRINKSAEIRNESIIKVLNNLDDVLAKIEKEHDEDRREEKKRAKKARKAAKKFKPQPTIQPFPPYGEINTPFTVREDK